MKALSISILLLATACATTAKYDAKVQSWKGADASVLLKTWGQPDAIEKLRNGDRMFLYTQPKYQPLAYGDRSLAANQRTPASSSTGVKCATYFEISPENKIVATLFRGDECVAKD